MIRERHGKTEEPPKEHWHPATIAALPDPRLLELSATKADCPAELAFAALVRRHGPMVLGVCQHFLADRHAAEDAFQATFLVLARKVDAIRQPELLSHWLYAVAVRTAKKAKRIRERRSRREGMVSGEFSVESIGEAPPSDTDPIRREEIERLLDEVSRLPEHYRVPIILCYLEGLTHAQAADRLRCPVGTVSVRLKRARELLRSRLVRRGLAPPAVLLATFFSSKTVIADAPAGALVDSTVRVSLWCRLVREAAAGIAPVEVSSLAGKILTEMSVRKLAVWMMLAVIVGGAAAVRTVTLAQPSPPPINARESKVPPISARVASEKFIHQTPSQIPTIRPSDDAISSPHSAGVSIPPQSTQPADDPAPIASNPTPVRDIDSYRELESRTGHDADSQVRLALWCAARGLKAEAQRHLTQAIQVEPDHTTARGLLGMVEYSGRWVLAESVQDRVRVDANLSAALGSYRTRRSKTAATADAQWKLAQWCERNGLTAEASAHAVLTTRLDPNHAAAWKKLGYKRVSGRWVRESELAAEQREAEIRKKADRHWRPLLTRWRNALDDRSQRADAEQALAQISDEHAIPAIWAVFSTASIADQRRLVQLLGQVDSPLASRLLAVLAVYSPAREVWNRACETLARRDPGEAIAFLTGLLRDPDPNPKTVFYRFQWIPVGALGVGSPGITLVEGLRADAMRIYTVDESRMLAPNLAVNNSFAARSYDRRKQMATERQLNELQNLVSTLQSETERAVLPASTTIRRDNARLILTLRNVASIDLGESWEAWKQWWVEKQGYAYDPEQYRNPPDYSFFDPKPIFIASTNNTSCFAAGTTVRTLSGDVPIETVGVGDQVLTQNVRTGRLGFSPVLQRKENPPAATLRIVVGDEPIVATGIHRFWKAGQGWTMARDLKRGDEVRTVNGPQRVEAVASDRVQPVFNLEVSESQSFFVGRSAILVHDNSAVEPISTPFDALTVHPEPDSSGPNVAR